MSQKQKIAFQGMAGAWSDLACRSARPAMEPLGCPSFEDAFYAVRDGVADQAMIPVDNTLAGRVADVHRLLPEAGLYIVGEHFQTIQHALLGVKGAKIEDLKHVHSHVHAIPQCARLIRKLGLTPHVEADTAGAAARIAEEGDPAHAAIAAPLAAPLYGLDVLMENIQDENHNTTRFLILAREGALPSADEKAPLLTGFVFRIRNIPAALYKALGGFATNGVNMAKIESYVDERFQAAQFYCEVEGHPDHENLALALDELGFFADEYRYLGTWRAHPFRETAR